VDTVGRNKKVIEEYIRNQIQDDIVADQLSMEEFIDLFTCEERKKKNKRK
jgi:putative transposase